MELSPRVPDLTALELLLSVGRHSSLGAAARDIGVSQQAVSARISSMEALTGVQLVTRSKRGSTLSPAGVVVAEWAARVLDAAGELDAGLAALRGDRRAVLRVSSSLTIAEQLLPGWLVAARSAARGRGESPGEVVLTAENSGRVVEHVRDGAADLGFVEGPSAPRGLHSRVIGHDELVVVAAPGHSWTRRRSPLSAAQLCATPLVSREPGSGTRSFLAEALHAALGAAAEQPPPALSLSTAAAVRSAVHAGAGPAVLSHLAVADDLDAGRLEAIPTVGLDLRRALRAVWIGPARLPAGPARDLLAHILGRQGPNRLRQG